MKLNLRSRFLAVGAASIAIAVGLLAGAGAASAQPRCNSYLLNYYSTQAVHYEELKTHDEEEVHAARFAGEVERAEYFTGMYELDSAFESEYWHYYDQVLMSCVGGN